MMEKYSLLLKKMKEKGKVAIAFSGGVDSSLVAYVAKQAGIESLLITLTSPLFPSYELKMAKEIASQLKIPHVIFRHSFHAEIAKNDVRRCYYCKTHEAKLWKEIAKKHGFNVVADGSNFDDLQDRTISPQIRVRFHKSIARIEVPIEKMNDVLKRKKEIVAYLKKLGFIYVTLDLEGYRSGSMHEEIKK
ncbi:hypothetical protein B6U81_06375 [Thermoplasmatales archaeon ex4484_30]|nr:MAG: hypothetical protein B6U81_06375 [Thermoplasmatales archaeon ex4484_30]